MRSRTFLRVVSAWLIVAMMALAAGVPRLRKWRPATTHRGDPQRRRPVLDLHHGRWRLRDVFA